MEKWRKEDKELYKLFLEIGPQIIMDTINDMSNDQVLKNYIKEGFLEGTNIKTWLDSITTDTREAKKIVVERGYKTRLNKNGEPSIRAGEGRGTLIVAASPFFQKYFKKNLQYCLPRVCVRNFNTSIADLMIGISPLELKNTSGTEVQGSTHSAHKCELQVHVFYEFNEDLCSNSWDIFPITRVAAFIINQNVKWNGKATNVNSRTTCSLDAALARQYRLGTLLGSIKKRKKLRGGEGYIYTVIKEKRSLKV